ncbi:MAG: hypothetical protein JRF54_15440, partial [Deltaproteobacteria bacterium]|nr:hypothetical protein [Deltaproteobacteria bacterium]
MKKCFFISLFVLAPIMFFAAPSSSAAQQPKMDIKVFVGFSATTFVSMLETGRERDTFAGWQIGFGPRIRRNKAFIEVLFSFNRWALSFSDPSFGTFTGHVNSFELPLNMGYIPYKNSYFKLFLYGGYVNHFNTKTVGTLVDLLGESIDVKLKPKDAGFVIYQAFIRLGVNFDLAMFNLD